MAKFVSKLFNQLKQAGARLLSGAQREFNIQVKVGKFDLDAHIEASEFNVQGGSKKAADWMIKSIKDRVYDKQVGGILEAGKLYLVGYPNPKHKDTLEFYDTQPLVLSLGHHKTSDGHILEIGINLHHLPMKVRKQVLIKVFEMFKNKYKGEMYREKQSPVEFRWSQIAKPLLPYGAAFAFRSYLPTRRTYYVEFKYEDWDKAIFIPSEKYVGISQSKLELQWKTFLMTKSFSQLSPKTLENILGSY